MVYRRLLHSLLPAVAGVVMLTAPADAGRLQTWRFDQDNNRLTFTTDTGVQPTAQLITNPTRLVIDLPGTVISQPTSRQPGGGLIREVRIGQFNSQTARIVIEVQAGYTIDPTQVRVQGLSPTQWVVELPTPERLDTAPTAQTPAPSRQPSPTADPVPAGDISGDVAPSPGDNAAEDASAEAEVSAPIQIESVRETADGLFVQLRGGDPEIEVDRDEDDREIRIDLENTSLSPRLTLNQRDRNFERPDLSRIQVTQLETDESDPPTARITLTLPERAPNWQASISGIGGLVIVPQRGTAFVEGERPAELSQAGDASIRVSPPDESADEGDDDGAEQANELATIARLSLADNERQLVIAADQPLTYTSQWNASENSYEVRIPAAQLADEVEGPQLTERSPIARIRLRQDADNTVVVLVQPAAGYRVGNLRRDGDTNIVLPLQRGAATTAPGTAPGATSIPVPAPDVTATPPIQPTTPSNLPRVNNARVVIIVDPGHGGRDPGAVGIGGLQEKNVVLPISQQVAALLEQQGVQVVMTRSDDRELDLEPRVQIAERANASLFVSIHANAISMSRPDVNGLETYYYSAAGQRLAQVIHNAVLQNVPIRDRGVRQARFYVLRRTSMPAVLVETGFVTGAEDARRLGDPAHQQLMASAIARGILQYIQQNF